MSRVDYERAATESPPEEGANGHAHDSQQSAAPKSRAKKAKANVLSVDQLQSLSSSQVRTAGICRTGGNVSVRSVSCGALSCETDNSLRLQLRSVSHMIAALIYLAGDSYWLRGDVVPLKC